MHLKFLFKKLQTKVSLKMRVLIKYNQLKFKVGFENICTIPNSFKPILKMLMSIGEKCATRFPT